MSTTRSPSPTEPLIKGRGGDDTSYADSVLIAIGHGTGSPVGDANLHRFVADLAGRGIFADVRAAVLYGAPGLAEAVEVSANAPVRLLPFLMGDGVIFGKRLAEAMAKISWRREPLLYPPLGLHPGLAELMARRAELAARALSWSKADSHLLLIAHGSLKDPASSAAARSHQARIAEMRKFAGVQAVFLEQPPYLDDVLASHEGTILGVGLFAGQGQHGARDMARSFGQAACPAHYCGAIGGDKGLPALALSHLLQPLSPDRAD